MGAGCSVKTVMFCHSVRDVLFEDVNQYPDLRLMTWFPRSIFYMIIQCDFWPSQEMLDESGLFFMSKGLFYFFRS